MKLSLHRKWYTDRSTIGLLAIDGVQNCYTLEDKVREVAGQPVSTWKIPKQTAIPSGTYTVTMDFSNRFQKVMPHVLDVPGFDGIRIHSGNTDADTEGCILVGQGKGPDIITNSRAAFAPLYALLEQAQASGEPISIEILNASDSTS